MTGIIIGCDNGLTGGLCAISRSHGKIIAKIPMPTIQHEHIFERTKTTKRKGVKKTERGLFIENLIDGCAVTDWILFVTDWKPCTVIIEECPMHADKQATMRSMGVSYGILMGAISARLTDKQIVVVRSGNPLDSWQRHMLGNLPKGETKQAAINKARGLWPDEDWITKPKGRTPDMGCVDAALIAEYGRLKQL